MKVFCTKTDHTLVPLIRGAIFTLALCPLPPTTYHLLFTTRRPSRGGTRLRRLRSSPLLLRVLALRPYGLAAPAFTVRLVLYGNGDGRAVFTVHILQYGGVGAHNHTSRLLAANKGQRRQNPGQIMRLGLSALLGQINEHVEIW